METSRYGRWFRMYDDALDDRKIHELGDKLGFFWLNCLCFASKSGGTLPLWLIWRGVCASQIRR